ncbi:hypothetical protein [Sporosarcina sp. NPDC096371]|uniref:hypothetical protein n=1 Tax=Sporosarcina sp. NPDC096371 TaxID=3364530 RepID=UPI003805AF91
MAAIEYKNAVEVVYYNGGQSMDCKLIPKPNQIKPRHCEKREDRQLYAMLEVISAVIESFSPPYQGDYSQ